MNTVGDVINGCVEKVTIRGLYKVRTSVKIQGH